MKSVVAIAALVTLSLSVLPVVAATEQPTQTCRQLPPNKRVKLSLKPETEVGDLVAWISSVTCKQFVVPGTIDTHKKVTIIAPQPINADEAYALFVAALDSVQLTLVPTGRFLRIIDTTKAKTSAIPVYIGNDEK